MRLVLYSGGYGHDNRALAAEAASLLKEKSAPVLTFVPNCSEDAAADFRDCKRQLAGAGIRRFRCIPIDRPLSPEDERALFASDAIFLGGGNTFYMLYHLRRRRLLARLRSYARSGGMLLGLSAGSILLTPSVVTARVPALDADENDVGLRDLRALGLVSFEFSPHYYPDPEADAELLMRSRRTRRLIYACADGQGVVVRNGSIRLVGGGVIFRNGRKIFPRRGKGEG